MREDSSLKLVYDRIINSSHDSVFVAADFLDIGDYNTVRQALLRLEKCGKIQKVMRGVYYHAQYSELIDEYEAPAPHQVALALARKFNWSIAPSGDTALNQLGLSTQVPACWSYISDGPYHQFQIGNIELEFKHRNNREISGMSYKTAMVIQALKTLGKGNVGENHIKILRRQLKEDDKDKLLREAQQSTMWVYDIVKKICME